MKYSLVSMLLVVSFLGCTAPPDPEEDDRPGKDLTPIELEALLQQRYSQRLSEKPRTEIRGKVVTIENTPLQGVNVRVGDQTVTTDKRGNFVFAKVQYGAYILSFEHPDYVFTQRPIAARYQDNPYLQVSMMRRMPARSFNTDQRTEFVQGSLKLTFEPGDLVVERTGVRVHGNVEIIATTVEPGKKGHIEAAPAPLEGLDSNNQYTALASLGMFEVELSQNGERVQVRPGATVNFSMKTPSGKKFDYGTTIPMWHHDKRLGIWVREPGLLAQVSQVSRQVSGQGEEFEVSAAVPHFSFWNLDDINPTYCVSTFVEGAIGFRSISTEANSTNEDGIWSMTGECRDPGLCMAMAPSGWTSAQNVSFKVQVLVNTTAPEGTEWCDVKVALLQKTDVRLLGDDLLQHAIQMNNGAPAYSRCGTYSDIIGPITVMGPIAAWEESQNTTTPIYQIALYPETNINTGEYWSSITCPNGTPIPPSSPLDSGFLNMWKNAMHSGYFSDADRDGFKDNIDRCPFRSKNATCNLSCYVPPTTPNRFTYDRDFDTVDNFCDNKMTIYNPTQNNGLIP